MIISSAYTHFFIRNWAWDLRRIKKLKSWISRKIKKLAILTCICGVLQYFLAKINKLSDYFSAKIKKLTGWIFDKFLIKKLSVYLQITNTININEIAQNTLIQWNSILNIQQPIIIIIMYYSLYNVYSCTHLMPLAVYIICFI